MVDAALAILVIDENPERAAVIEEGLRESGFGAIRVISDMRNLLRQIVNASPDVIVIDLENPSRDVLEQMFQVSRSVPRPVAMFVDQSDRASIEAAIEAGVSAYVVDGLRKERIRPVVEMAISRHNAYRKLRDELDRTKQALEDRKVIERAKGVLMKAKGLNEDDAHAALRAAAMRESRRLAEVAQAVVTAAKLLG